MLIAITKVETIEGGLRTLCAWICGLIYPLIAKLFQLFVDISQIMVLQHEQYKTIYNRITIFLSIIMVFYVTFEFVKYLIQPDTLSDKEKGAGNLGKKIIVVVLLIAFVPTIFEYSWKLQNFIIKSDFISKIILGKGFVENGKNGEAIKIGNQFSAIMFSNFYNYEGKWNDDEGTNECEKGISCKRIVESNLSGLATEGEFANLTLGINAAQQNPMGDTNIALITFDGLFAVLVGMFIFYILVLYTIDVAKRVFQFTYLQIIAPIPIIGYLSPKKDNIFNKWLKQCTATYLDLFIRLSIMYFVLLISSIISNAMSNGDFLNNVNNLNSNTKLIYIVLILGLLLFAQKAPKLIEELLPKSMTAAGGNFGLKAGERVAPLAARAIGASYGGLRRLAGGAISRGMNAHRRNKLEYERTGKTAKERRQDAKEAKGALKQTSQEYKMARNQRNNAARKFGTNSEQYKKAQKAFEKSRDALNEKQSTFADAMNSRRQSVFGNAVAGGVAGALRGAKAGFGATKLEEINKKAKEGATADKKAIAAREQWLNSGGYSSTRRMVSGIEQRMGITTDAQRRERDIKVTEAQAKKEQTLMKRESEVGSKIDSAKDSITSRMKSGKDVVTIHGDGGGTIKTYKYKDATGTERTHSVDVGAGKTTSQIISERTAAVNGMKASAESAQAEVEKMQAKKLASKAWDATAESNLVSKRASLSALQSQKSSKSVWTEAKDNQLESVKSQRSILESQRPTNSAAAAAWDLVHGSELTSLKNLETTMEAEKTAAWSQEDEEKFVAAQREVEKLEEDKKLSWTTENETSLTNMIADADNKTQKANEAESDLAKFTTAVAEDVYDQIVKKISAGEEVGSEYHPSYTNKVRESLTYVQEAARDEDTRNALKAALDAAGLPDSLYREFITGNITSYSNLDKIKGKLDNIASERGRTITELQGTQARMESNNQYAAAKANDSASNGGSK